MLYYERKFKAQGFGIIIGVDEVGRGPLAGPVVAAAVCLKKSVFKNRIDDSKKLTALEREKAFLEIGQKATFALGIINETVIDLLNIHQANRLVMEHAVLNLVDKLRRTNRLAVKKKNICVLIDGNLKLGLDYTLKNIIKGDGKSKSIAAASIVAKVIRDRLMSVYDQVYPGYGFRLHKGYATRLHKSRLRELGSSPIHRKSFSYV